MRTILYDREKALDYAILWAHGRNPAFYNFHDIGGDCTNFASQCLLAGGGVMNYKPLYGWFYIDANNRTPSWTGVEYFFNFLISNDGEGPFGSVCSREEAKVGDFVQLGDMNSNFYHTLIVVEKERERLLVATHSYDVYGKSLDSYQYDRVRFLHIEGVRTR